MNKQRFIITCTTDWCSMDNEFPALAENESDLWEYADELAVNNLMAYVSMDELAEYLGYYEDDYDPDEWQILLDNIEISDYVRYTIEPFEGTNEGWNELIKYHGEVYEEKSKEN